MALFQVGHWTFPSKKALLARLQQCLHSHPEGEPLEGENGQLLRALLDRHPSADEKLKEGCAYLTVGRDSFGGRNFRIVRPDGTQEPFAFRKTVISCNPKTEYRQRTKRAFRQEVTAQTQQVKADAVGSLCPVSGLPLEWAVTDVDHVGEEFTPLLNRFLRQQGLALGDLEHEESESGDLFHLTDRALAALWALWHAQHAKLVAKHRDAHRQKNGSSIKPLAQTYLTGSPKMQPVTRSVIPAPIPDTDWL